MSLITGSKERATRSYNNRIHVLQGAAEHSFSHLSAAAVGVYASPASNASRWIPAVSSAPDVSFSMPPRQDICHMLPRRRLTTLLALTSLTLLSGRSDVQHDARPDLSSFLLWAKRQALGNCVHSRTQTAARLIPRDWSERRGRFRIGKKKSD